MARPALRVEFVIAHGFFAEIGQRRPCSPLPPGDLQLGERSPADADNLSIALADTRQNDLADSTPGLKFGSTALPP